jgi:diguanylate cyclase (GGDEF)-like protein/PAS domain S-box-containing protein
LAVFDVLVGTILVAFNWHESHHRRALNQALETTRRDADTLRIAAAAFESQEGILVIDKDQVIRRINRAFISMTGYEAEELIGQNADLLRTGLDDLDLYNGIWESASRFGTWQGEAWIRHKNETSILVWLVMTVVTDAAGIVTNYVLTMTDFTERKAAEEEIQRLAFYDPLTELPNRRYLVDRLHRALAISARHGRDGALIFIDLDLFKDLNDAKGHSFGDMLLKQVGERLSTCVREGDTVARLGGDEFVVLLEDLGANPVEAEALTETVSAKILAVFGRPFQLADYQHHITASIGATLFQGHRDSVDELLRRADIAMYQAKASGRNAVRFFDPKVPTDATVP